MHLFFKNLIYDCDRDAKGNVFNRLRSHKIAGPPPIVIEEVAHWLQGHMSFSNLSNFEGLSLRL